MTEEMISQIGKLAPTHLGVIGHQPQVALVLVERLLEVGQVQVMQDAEVQLRVRVARITKTGMAWTQEPRSRLRRLVSNIEIYDHPDGLVQTFSNFHLTELRVNRRDPVEWIGRTEHRLRPHGDDFKLAYKKVMLINNDHEMTQLSCMV